MARKKSSATRSSRFPRVFVVANLLLWGVIGGWYFLQPPARQAEVNRLVRNCFDSRKQVTAFDVAWDIWQFYYSQDFVGAVAETDDRYVYAGAPQLSAAFGGPLRILNNTGHVTGYSDPLGNPVWTAYKVSDREFGRTGERPDEFAMDVRTAARIAPQDYTRSGYDRGHMAPSYAIAVHYGLQAQLETFLMSNISPQKHGLNAGAWKRLEQKIAANYPARFEEVWILAGPVFGENPPRLKGRVAVPDAFYMIVVDENEGRVRAQAFLLPQGTPPDADPADFLTTIDEIEQRTGLDFLSALPDDAENALEARAVARVW